MGLYIQESLSTKKPTRRTKRLQEVTAIEEYRHVGLYNINPFTGVPDDPTVYDDIFDAIFVSFTGEPVIKTLVDNLEDQILQDYTLNGENTINLLNLFDFLDWLKNDKAYNYYLDNMEQIDTNEFRCFINGFLRKYWPQIEYPPVGNGTPSLSVGVKKVMGIVNEADKFKLEEFVRQYILYSNDSSKLNELLNEEKAKFNSVLANINIARSRIELINNISLDKRLDFKQCYILEIVIHVN